jgi:hypothetical protein
MIRTKFKYYLSFLSLFRDNFSIIVAYCFGYINLFTYILMLRAWAILTPRMLIGWDVLPI